MPTPAALRYTAIPTSELDRIRKSGVDDFGHPVRTFTADGDGSPLRCCLRDAAPGEQVALLSWQPLTHAPDNVYAEVGPVFVHADACAGYQHPDRYPDGFRRGRQVLRSYTHGGDMLDTAIAEHPDAERTIAELLESPDAAVVHSRNVQAGCYMFAISKA